MKITPLVFPKRVTSEAIDCELALGKPAPSQRIDTRLQPAHPSVRTHLSDPSSIPAPFRAAVDDWRRWNSPIGLRAGPSAMKVTAEPALSTMLSTLETLRARLPELKPANARTQKRHAEDLAFFDRLRDALLVLKNEHKGHAPYATMVRLSYWFSVAANTDYILNHPQTQTTPPDYVLAHLPAYGDLTVADPRVEALLAFAPAIMLTPTFAPLSENDFSASAVPVWPLRLGTGECPFDNNRSGPAGFFMHDVTHAEGQLLHMMRAWGIIKKDEGLSRNGISPGTITADMHKLVQARLPQVYTHIERFSRIQLDMFTAIGKVENQGLRSNLQLMFFDVIHEDVNNRFSQSAVAEYCERFSQAPDVWGYKLKNTPGCDFNQWPESLAWLRSYYKR